MLLWRCKNWQNARTKRNRVTG